MKICKFILVYPPLSSNMASWENPQLNEHRLCICTYMGNEEKIIELYLVPTKGLETGSCVGKQWSPTMTWLQYYKVEVIKVAKGSGFSKETRWKIYLPTKTWQWWGSGIHHKGVESNMDEPKVERGKMNWVNFHWGSVHVKFVRFLDQQSLLRIAYD